MLCGAAAGWRVMRGLVLGSDTLLPLPSAAKVFLNKNGVLARFH